MPIIKLVLYHGPIGPPRPAKDVELIDGQCIFDYLPPQFAGFRCVVRLNGGRLDAVEQKDVVPVDGDEISVRPIAGELTALGVLVVGAIVSIVLSVVVKIGEWAWNKYVTEPEASRKRRKNEVGATYAIDIMQNTTRNGSPVPVVMGLHRTGGTSVEEYTRNFISSDSVTTGAIVSKTDLHSTLTIVSEGPVGSIATAQIEGEEIAEYPGSTLESQLGTNVQTTVTGFSETVTTVAKNQQMTAGTWYEDAGTKSVDAALYKITWASGLYHQTHDGDLDTQSPSFYIQCRTSAGPGSWGWWGATPSPSNPGGVFTAGNYMWVTWRTHAQKAPFSSYLRAHVTAGAQYDWRIQLPRNLHDPDHRSYGDAYIKEFQEISNDGYTYPNRAIAGLKSVSSASLSGKPSRRTFLVEGVKVHEIVSATEVSAAATTRCPADLLLGMVYNRRWGLARRINTDIEVTVAGSTGVWTIGEEVRGPGSTDTVYVFRGEVVSHTFATGKAVLRSLQGVPHGLLTGQTSGETATMSSIDECYGINLSGLFDLKTFNAVTVPDGEAISTVDVNTASGQKVLSVAATTPFTAGDTVVINFEGDREERGTIDTVQAGVSITLLVNLTYAHTLAQADEVSVSEPRHYFDFVWDGSETGRQALDRFQKISRCVIVDYGTYLDVIPLQLQTPTQLFTMGNILAGSFKMSYHDISERKNRLSATFVNASIGYKEDVVSRDADELDTAGEEVKDAELELFGSVRASQTLREIWYALKRARNVTHVIEFSIGLEMLNTRAGYPIYFAHDVPGYGYGSGRAKTSTSTTVTLSDPVTIPTLGTPPTIRVRHADDTMETATISNGAGTWSVITITAPWATNPSEGDVYVVGDANQYRIISISEPDDDLHVTVQAEYDPSAAYSEKYGLTITDPTYTFKDPDEWPPDVTDVTLTDVTIQREGETIHNLDVAYEPGEFNSQYKCHVYWRRGLPDYSLYGHEQGDNETMGNESLSNPSGICTDGTNVYVCDTSNHRVIKMGYADWDYSDSIGTWGTGNTNFKSPNGICTDGTHFWVCDTDNHRIKKHLCADMSFVGELGSKGTGDGQFQWPFDITIDTTNSRLFVADTGNHRLQKLGFGAPNPTYVSKIGSAGSGDDQFQAPMGVCCYANSHIIVADTQNYRIVKRTIADAMVYVAKVGSQGVTASTFCGPRGIETDGTSVWVTDGGYDGAATTLRSRFMVRLFSDLSASTAWTATDAGDGPDELNVAMDVAIDTYAGAIFIADTKNHRLHRRENGVATVDTEWNYAGFSTNGNMRLPKDFAAGTFVTAAVCVSTATNKIQQVSDAPNDSILVARTGLVPRTPSALTFQILPHGAARLWWERNTDPATSYWELRKGADWETGIVLADNIVEVYYDVSAPMGSSATYFIKAVNSGGVYSAASATVTVNLAATASNAQSTAVSAINMRT